MVAAKILESEVFRYNDGPEYIGHPREVNFVLREQSERKELRIYIARKNLICKGRFLPLIDSVAEHCGIENHTSWRLLDSALSSSHINRVHDVFHAAGYAGHDRRKGVCRFLTHKYLVGPNKLLIEKQDKTQSPA